MYTSLVLFISRYSEPTPDRQLNVVNVSQWEKDTILVCYDYKNSSSSNAGNSGTLTTTTTTTTTTTGAGHIVQLVNMNGKPKTKSNKNGSIVVVGNGGGEDAAVAAAAATTTTEVAAASPSAASSSSEIQFNFPVESIVALRDGQLLAFHKHGLQGRSFKTNQVTQETEDESKEFRLLGSDNLVILESKPLNEPEAYCNLYLLRGHEDLS